MRATIRTACFGLLLLAASIGSSQAGIIYDLTSLGGDKWRYDYEVTNDSPAQPLGWFTVFFALSGYESICDGDATAGICGVAPSAPAGWDAFVAQPDPLLPDNGFFDASTLGTGIAPGQSLAGFSVVFRWLDAGTPGSQPFDFIDQNPASPVQTGFTTPRQTVSAPEPRTLVLLGLAMLGLACTTSKKHWRPRVVLNAAGG